MKMLERPDLARRGWTATLMTKFLPDPEGYRETRDARIHAAHQWRKDTIIRVECGRAFRGALMRSMGRRGMTTCEAAHALQSASYRLERLSKWLFPPVIVIEDYSLLSDAELRHHAEIRDDGLAKAEHQDRRYARAFGKAEYARSYTVNGIREVEIEDMYDRLVSRGKLRKEQDQ